MALWNPWHGCHKISEGCRNCYVYRRDEAIGKPTGIVKKTNDFDLPLQKNRQRQYRLTAAEGTVYTCMTSDFFVEEADEWRGECWKMIRHRQDLSFFIITKRIDRFMECIPDDWGQGYPNVTIGSTCENQDRADYRLPFLIKAPIQHKRIIHEPMLGPIDISIYLQSGEIEEVVCGGESGDHARPCNYDWVLAVRDQCVKNSVPFYFKQTGAIFVKNGKVFHIERKYQLSQAQKADINFYPDDIANGRNHGNREEWLQQDLFVRIAQSPFRSRFRLKDNDFEYIERVSLDTIQSHAQDFVRTRLSPRFPENDGKQTPMKGHPVFLAQHACACCCRGCLQKWHDIPEGVELSETQQDMIVDMLMEWISRQIHEDEGNEQITIDEMNYSEGKGHV